MERENSIFMGFKIPMTVTRVLMVVLILALYVNPFSQQFAIKAEAASNGTVNGTVASGTTDTLMKLNTTQGTMLIKLDSDVVISGSGAIFEGAKVAVDWKYGNDGYLHTSRIVVSGTTNWGAVIDTLNFITIQGTVLKDTDVSTLLLDYNGSALKIRMDSTTAWDNCHYIYPGRQISVTIARGSDAYFHALKISSTLINGTNGTQNSTTGTQTTLADGRTLSTVSGVVQDGATDSLFRLSVNGNIMKIIIDSDTDLSGIHALIPGTTITVSVYRGSDAVLHAYSMVGSISTTASGARSGSIVNVTGTVQTKTTDNILYLNTSGGQMIIKLDPDTSIGTTGLLVLNKTVTVGVQRGSDSYLHAVTISSSSAATTTSTSVAASATTTRTSDEVKVSGVVQAESNNAVLYLRSSAGTMAIRLDANTVWPGSKAFTTGEELTAMVYRGADASLHAASVSSYLDACPATVLNAATQLTFSGTITKVQGYNITLTTSDGDMIFRMDNSTDFSGMRMLVSNKTVSITGMTGSDGYWHALTVVQK